LFFFLAPGETWRFMAKIETGKDQAVIDKLNRLYRRFNPGFSFEYSYLDADY
jgi:hypothetical protein